MDTYHIEPLKPVWIPEVAAIHMQALPDDFLPSLGFNFLQNVFFPAALNSSYGSVYVAVKNDHPVGFVVITQDSSRFFRSILQDQFWGFLITGLRTSFSSFQKFKKNLEILTSMFNKGVDAHYGEIYEIAVHVEKQGQGIGKALVNQSIEYLKLAGITGIKIKTRKNNTDWINFFMRSGWHLSQEIRLINNEYVILSLEFHEIR